MTALRHNCGRKTSALACFLFAATLSSAQLPQVDVTDVQGHRVAGLAGLDTRAVVLIFAATDCPISNRYIPEIARLENEFAARGVAFWWVFPNPEDTAPVVRKHASAYSVHAKSILDTKQELVRLAHASVTPEAAVFSVDKRALKEQYHGRVDDLYYSFGKSRPSATHHDLEDAIRAVLAGREVSRASHGPVGCSIVPLVRGSVAK